MRGERRINAGKVSDLTTEHFTIITADNISVGIILTENGVKAFLNVCPHAGAPICQGEVTNLVISNQPYHSQDNSEVKIIKCPWHKYEYDLITGNGIIPDSGKLISIDTEEINGELFLLI